MKKKNEKINVQALSRSATFSPIKRGMDEEIFYKKITKAYFPGTQLVANKAIIKKFQNFEMEQKAIEDKEKRRIYLQQKLEIEHEKLKKKREEKDKQLKEKQIQQVAKLEEIYKKKKEFEDNYRKEQRDKLKEYKTQKKEISKIKNDIKTKLDIENEEKKKKIWDDYAQKQNKSIVDFIKFHFFFC